MPLPLIYPEEPSTPGGTALALFRIRFVFSQDQLLDTRDFLKKAKDYGYNLNLAKLQQFHNDRLLLPLFRVGDFASTGRAFEVPSAYGMGARGEAIEAMREGRLQDCLHEGYSVDWPYERPTNIDPHDWWNGFLYSPWQLLDIRQAINEDGWQKRGQGNPLGDRWMRLGRARTQVLSALATRYLPSILGTMSLPLEAEYESVAEFEQQADIAELLRIARFDAEHLYAEAQRLLVSARFLDPLKDWWPLLRYGNNRGWSKFHGPSLESLWQRIAAEIILRAHEDLSLLGQLQPLPDLTGVKLRDPLMDRISPREGDTKSLERALADFGLSPHPRVLMLLEGQTEMVHVPRLLAELGIDRPSLVRVQNCHSSRVNAQLITRYAVAPRLSKDQGDIQRLDVSPTAVVIAMDPENDWATEEKRERERKSIRQAIREEVEDQGGVIVDEDLDYLVHIFVWGEDSYEIANFSDDELVNAVTILASEQSNNPTASSTWEVDLRKAIAQGRRAHAGLQRVIGPLGVHEKKIRLAEILWPSLLAKYERELSAGDVVTPVLVVIQKVRELVQLLSRSGYILRKPDESN